MSTDPDGVSMRAGFALARVDLETLRLDVAALSGRYLPLGELAAAVDGSPDVDARTAVAIAIALNERLAEDGLPHLFEVTPSRLGLRLDLLLRAAADELRRSAALADRARAAGETARDLVATSRLVGESRRAGARSRQLIGAVAVPPVGGVAVLPVGAVAEPSTGGLGAGRSRTSIVELLAGTGCAVADPAPARRAAVPATAGEASEQAVIDGEMARSRLMLAGQARRRAASPLWFLDAEFLQAADLPAVCRAIVDVAVTLTRANRVVLRLPRALPAAVSATRRLAAVQHTSAHILTAADDGRTIGSLSFAYVELGGEDRYRIEKMVAGSAATALAAVSGC